MINKSKVFAVLLVLLFLFAISCNTNPGGDKNHNPTISLSADKTTVATGGTVTIIAEVQDQDNDPLTVTWSTGSGTLNTTTGLTVIWTAPASPANYNISATVTDGHKGSASTGVSVLVQNPQASISYSPTGFNFTATQGGKNPDDQILNISNNGSSELNWQVSDDAAWLNLNPNQGISDGTAVVSVNISGLGIGTYNAMIIITADGTTNTPVNIPITLTVSEATTPKPTIFYSPASFNFTATQGGQNPEDQTLGIFNNMTGQLNWQVSDDAAWLNLNPNQGISDGTAVVSVNISGLGIGTYNANITITDPNATNSPVNIPVTLTVNQPTAQPVIGYNPTSFNFTATQGSQNPEGQTLNLSNNGGGVLNWQVSDDAAWLNLNPNQGAGNSSVTVSANISSLGAGTYNANITVTDPGATNSPVNIPVTLTVTQPPVQPVIGYNPTSFNFTATQGGSNPSAQTLNILNNGNGVLSWQVSDDAAWLNLNPNQGAGNSSVTVSANISGFGAGTYNTNITIIAQGANNSPVNIPVTLTVKQFIDSTAPAIISTSPLNNETNVHVNAKITANFSEPMNTGTINNTTFTVAGIAGIITYTGTTATFTPSGIFAYNTKYTATISTGVKDSAGNNMAANYPWSFTTEQIPPPSAPNIAVSDGDGQATISWNAVTTATSYDLYWDTAAGVNKTKGKPILNVTSPYNHIGITNGKTYYYIVTAKNAGGESPLSNEVSAKPIPLPILSVNPNSLNFGTVQTSNTFNITNTGTIGSTLTWSLFDNQIWLGVSPASGTTTTEADTTTVTVDRTGLIRGTYPGTINIISDGGNKSVSVSMSVPNHIPVITSNPIDSTEIDVKYTYNVIATDADNDNLTYSLTTAPNGMGINSGTGVLTWTPNISGTYPVVISVNDGNGGIVTQNFSLKVKGTYIISDISEDTVWRKSGNPYVLANSILVNTGITLTIEQGVKVIFKTLKALQIDGTLIARGTDTENIIFTSNAFGPKAGDWGYILFNDSSIDSAFDRDGNYTGGSILEYCVVEYAGGANVGTNGAVRTVKAYPLINYCTIRNNKGAGINAWWDGYPLSADDIIKITNNTVSNNTAGGVNVNCETYTIYNNNINNNSGGGINAGGYNATISCNIINKNNDGGINVSATSSASIFTISNNIISNNTANNGGGILFYANFSTISNNIISNNTAINNGGGIYANGWSISYAGNIIINNTAQNAAAVYYGSNSYLNFKYNTITGNIATGGKPIYTIYINYNNTLFNYNNIFSNTATDTDIYELWNDNTVGSPNLNAENNWWGTNSEIEIQAKIYDWQDLPSKGKVDYTPWLTSINIDAPISAPAELTAVSGTSGKILLSWSNNPESDISGYIVHWGTQPGNYTNSINVGSTTSYTITGLSKGTYYIALTAYDIYYSGDKDDPATIVNENQTGGNESWYSDEKTIEIIDGSKGELALTATTLFGTTADEKGTSVSVLGNTLFLSGITSANANDGIAARYSLPLSDGAVPLWNASWPILNGSDEFYGAAVSNKGVFLAGNSYNRTSDTAGGKEVKGIVVRFPLNGATGLGFSGSIWDKQTPSLPGAFSYGGTETLFGITGNQNFIYTTGFGQQNFANGMRMHISKLDTTGNILWTKTDGAEMQNNASSVGNAITTLYNNIYVAGTNRDDGTKGRPYLRKYDTSGTLKWSRKTTSLIGSYNGVNSFGGSIYAVGSTLDDNYQPLNFIIEKWDETGNLRWSKQYDRSSAEDVLYGVVGFGPYIYAVGSTRGNTSGGADVVILKIDPVTGDLISTTLWGGNLDDIARGIVTDGNDLYITGETKSFGEGGNDVILLRYSVQ